MKSVSGPSVFSAVDRFVDRAIGADGLTPNLRDKLLAQQMTSVGYMFPAITAASLVVAALFMVLSWGTSLAWPMALCVTTILFLAANASRLGARLGDSSTAQEARGAARGLVAHSALLGALWGVAFNMLPSSTGGGLTGTGTMGLGGLLVISAVALVNFPQALAAFTIPLIVGGLGALVGAQASADLMVQGALLMAFTFVMVTVTFNHASAFVAHRASDLAVKEKGEIIGLLLGEFEQTTSDWIWAFDADGSLTRVSSGFTNATGVPEADLLGADFIHFLRCITPPQDPLMGRIEEDVAGHGTFQNLEVRVTADGEERWWSLTGKPAYDEAGTYVGYMGTTSDITERKAAERRITVLAHHDSMTGLLNRTKFTEQLGSCVARLERYGTPFAVMFLDLDHFKSVNDSRGHMAGDRLLVQVARRIQSLVRETDLVARLGGDEFALILPHDTDPDHLSVLATRLIDAIREPYQVDGDDPVSIGVSVGIAIAPVNGTRPDQLLRNADLALYRAKADGRSVYRFFETQMDSEARERRLLEAELRDAIANGELVLHYQPLVSAKDHQPTGFEALIRWNHPIRGLVPPAEFIPIAEQSNLIVEIGDWTIEEACRTAANWPEGLTVAVNLSSKHFHRSDISTVVKKALAISGLDARRLEIEITEGLLIDDPDAVIAKLAEVRELGVTVAMDDFGTGYSSLSYLLKFPFDKIKIDRSFVDAASDDEVARDILRAIASLGKTLKVTITAEGVETETQAAFLAEIACHQLQGFLFARPLDAVELPHYLLTHVPTRAAAVKAEAELALAS